MLTINIDGLTDFACGFGSPHYAIPDFDEIDAAEFPSPLNLAIRKDENGVPL